MPTKDKNTEQPKASEPGRSQESLATLSGDLGMDRFARIFEASARRWDLIVYPALFMFIILAAYGFYLVFSLTEDMHTLAKNVDANMAENMRSMSENLNLLSRNVALMSDRISEMSLNMENIDENTTVMNDYMADISTQLDTLTPILANMQVMTRSIQNMDGTIRVITANTGVMSRDMSIMNQNVSRPMGVFNSFMPW